MKLTLFLVLGLAGLGACVGCSSTIETNQTATGAGGGTNSGGATASASSAGTGGGSAGGTASGGAGGGDPCANAFLTITLDSGDPPPMLNLNASCQGSWGSTETPHALGYEGYFGGGPNAMHELAIEGCQGQQGPGHLTLSVPLFDAGTAATDDGLFQLSGTSWKTVHGVKVTITELGELHQLIKGSYAGTMSDGTTQHHVSGAFAVCRVGDFLPP